MINSKKNKIVELNKRYSKVMDTEDIVVGHGDLDAIVLFIGEAPGKNELIEKRPFVGKAGQKFSEILKKLEIERDEIYLTNTIKYGLRKTNEKTGRSSNRPAKKEEMIKSRPFLIEEIKIISPKIIITLGNVPIKTLLNDFNINISKVVGEIIEFDGMMIFPLYHPAALIYNPNLVGKFDDNLEKLNHIISIHCK